PNGALEGMIAVTWSGRTDSGKASTDVVPWVTLTETPDNDVESGTAAGSTAAPSAGPSRAPEMTNTDPRAMEPLGRPAGSRLAAFKILLGVIRGRFAAG